MRELGICPHTRRGIVRAFPTPANRVPFPGKLSRCDFSECAVSLGGIRREAMYDRIPAIRAIQWTVRNRVLVN